MTAKQKLGIFALLASTAMLGTLGCASVDQTEYCIGTRNGKVVDPHMGTGLNEAMSKTANCFTLLDQSFPADAHSKETIESQTRDPMTVEGDVAIVYRFQPDKINEIFNEKHTQEAAEVQILNSIRDGYRSAIAGWYVNDIFSSRRSALGCIRCRSSEASLALIIHHRRAHASNEYATHEAEAGNRQGNRGDHRSARLDAD